MGSEWEQMTEAERARVRAAARDLLEALEWIGRNSLDAASRDRARAAIAKARGK